MKNIHILKTDKPSILGYIFEAEQYHLIKGKDDLLDNLAFYRHIYITSDEEIEEGDWVLGDFPDKPVGKVVSKYVEEFTVKSLNGDKYGLATYDSKKIILTTDQDLIKDGVQAIDDEFLEWFVKNPTCEWVEIEKQHQNHLPEKYCNNADYVNCSEQQYEFLKRTLPSCKLRILYKIIIPKGEPKQETLLKRLQEYIENNPKEEAERLWNKFSNLANSWIEGKKCAVGAVDEIIKSGKDLDEFADHYWQQVKQEIEKL